MFYGLNIHPVLLQLQEECTSWANLPLKILGRINMRKITFLPKFLYVFRNCPTWVKCSFFREVDRCVSSFLSAGTAAHLAKSTIQLLASCGGLALPNY